jgi:transposase InsO family protein
VGNILKRRGIPTAPERKKTTTWKEFIRRHMDMLWATDFFSTEVWTLGGLVTFYVLFFIKLDTREVHIAGITAHPTEQWMMQVARNLTMEEWGVLKPGQYLIHDRDQKFCPAYNDILDNAGVKRLPLPPRSPNLNAIAERFVRSIKEEAVSRFILFGEKSLRHVVTEYLAHYHAERAHQGKGNVILLPEPRPEGCVSNLATTGPIECRERQGGMLKYYERKAA